MAARDRSATYSITVPWYLALRASSEYSGSFFESSTGRRNAAADAEYAAADAAAGTGAVTAAIARTDAAALAVTDAAAGTVPVGRRDVLRQRVAILSG